MTPSGTKAGPKEVSGLEVFLRMQETDDKALKLAPLSNIVRANYYSNRSTGNAPNKTNFRTPMSIGAHQRYANLIGNVLGTTGFHTVYQKDDTNQNGPDNFIYQVGFWNRWDSAQTPYDTATKTSMFRWGNWDNVSNANRFNNAEVPTTDATFPNPIPASQAIPASLYTGVNATTSCGTGLSFWKNPTTGFCPQYPPIGPDVSCTTNCNSNVASHAGKIPAQLCYEGTAKDANGYLTAFDSATCYAADTGSGVPIAQVLPSSSTFSPTLVGQTIGPLSVSVNNIGSATLIVSGVSLPASDFAISSTPCGSLPWTISSGASCIVNITFTPTQAGFRGPITLSIIDNSSGSPHTMTVNGSGQIQTAPAGGLLAVISQNRMVQ